MNFYGDAHEIPLVALLRERASRDQELSGELKNLGLL